MTSIFELIGTIETPALPGLEDVATSAPQAAGDSDASDFTEEPEEITPGTVYESIETNMWLAEAYFRKGAEGLGRECLRVAWSEYLQFRDILHVFAGEELGKRIVNAILDDGRPLTGAADV